MAAAIVCNRVSGLRVGYHQAVQICFIEPHYYAVDRGTGVALIRAEDKPGPGELVNFMRDSTPQKPGVVVPVCWEMIHDYCRKRGEIPTLFQWPQFVTWLEQWPHDEPEFQKMWRKLFGMPGEDLADAALIVWEEH